MTTLREAALAAAIVGGVTLGVLGLRGYLAPTNLAMVYLLGVAAIAMRCRPRTAVVSSFASVAAFDFFCVPPYYTFGVADSEYVVTFAVTLVVALAISTQTGRLRTLAEEARGREARTDALYRLSHALSGETRVFDAARSAATLAQEVFGVSVIILLSEEGKISFDRRTSDMLPLPRTDEEAAQWCFDHRKPAGAGASEFRQAAAIYLPLIGARETYGVMAVVTREPAQGERRHLLEVFATQTGAAIERMLMQRSAEESRVHMQTEQMRSSLLSAVSHDLRTPLATITGAASTLRDQDARLDADTRRELLESISDEAERLSRLVTNLLDMTRFESGGVQLQRDLYPIEEIVGSTLRRLEPQLHGRTIVTDLPADLPLIPADDVLLGQVLWNLLDNAVKYTPEGSPIEIAARAERHNDGGVVLEIRDRGPGIPFGEEDRIFEKFYRGAKFHRGAGRSAHGAGLGLPICRAIVTAHGGTIQAFNRDGGGAVFRIQLPAESSS